MQMLPTKKAQNSLKRFARVYEQAFMKGEFFLKIHELGEPVPFIDGKPFRPCFVVNLFKAHLCLFMKLETGYHPPAIMKEKINTDAFLKQIEKAYAKYGKLALKVIAMQKGRTDTIHMDFIRAYKYIVDLSKRYNIDWDEVDAQIKENKAKRVYRKRREERKMTDDLIAISRKLEKQPDLTESPRPKPDSIELPKVEGYDENLEDDF
jgi:hypothetical protein